MSSKFKLKPFDKRFKESTYMMNKHSNSVCCIIDKLENCKNINELKKNKFIIPKDLLISQLIYIIKKRIVIDSRMSVFIYINNIIPMSNLKIGEVYKNYKDDDGFLYIKYAIENTFG